MTLEQLVARAIESLPPGVGEPSDPTFRVRVASALGIDQVDDRLVAEVPGGLPELAALFGNGGRLLEAMEAAWTVPEMMASEGISLSSALRFLKLFQEAVASVEAGESRRAGVDESLLLSTEGLLNLPRSLVPTGLFGQLVASPGGYGLLAGVIALSFTQTYQASSENT